MAKIVTLNRNSNFRRLYSRGRSYTNPALVTYVLKNRAGICRIGITCSKKIGNAVERNRSKRLIKAAYANICDEINGNFDIVFVSRVRTRSLKSTQISKIMYEQLKLAGVIK
ncbi:MAG: ribonuclease P protein component [Oscillospiraceae bacterium]